MNCNKKGAIEFDNVLRVLLWVIFAVIVIGSLGFVFFRQFFTGG